MENHRISKIKRSRKMGFRARNRSKNGHKIFRRKRGVGRSINCV
ncbi:MAG: 50S ribosomal protein L34 [Planctomycetes bacterium]|nr:50S ribosomal protein L34 [Planctomycetota bacterium]